MMALDLHQHDRYEDGRHNRQLEIVERDSDIAPRYDVETDFLFLHDFFRLLYLRQIGVMG